MEQYDGCKLGDIFLRRDGKSPDASRSVDSNSFISLTFGQMETESASTAVRSDLYCPSWTPTKRVVVVVVVIEATCHWLVTDPTQQVVHR